ncbi:sucrase ferredoxin, partial [Streptomyces sp. 4F]
RTDGAAPRWEVTVAHADGRHWRGRAAHGASAPPRPESCGASVLGSPARMEVTAVRELSVTAALAS